MKYAQHIPLPLNRLSSTNQSLHYDFGLKVLATIPYFNFHFFPHLLIFLQFRDRSLFLPEGGPVEYGVGHDFFDELKGGITFFDELKGGYQFFCSFIFKSGFCASL